MVAKLRRTAVHKPPFRMHHNNKPCDWLVRGVGGWMSQWALKSMAVSVCSVWLWGDVLRWPFFMSQSTSVLPPHHIPANTHTHRLICSQTHTHMSLCGTLASSFVLAFIWVLLHMDKCSPQYGRQSIPAFMDTKGRENQEWKKLGQLGPGAHPACLILLMVWDKAACDRECVCAHLHVCFCLDRKQTSSYFCYDFQQCSQRPDI